mgnify:CR=1 FL=1
MSDEMPSEVDVTGGERGKYHRRFWSGDANAPTTANPTLYRLGRFTSPPASPPEPNSSESGT